MTAGQSTSGDKSMHTVNDAFRQLPPGSITSSDMSWNRTGSWRYLRPRLVQKVSPCSEACPAGNDVEAFVYLAGQRRYEEALERILEESPFPGVCGRVCYHPCEASCNRKDFDGAVSVQGIERFLSELPSVSPLGADKIRAEKVAVVGSGPAGMTCAYHLAGLGYRVTVFEKEDSLGGMLRLGIPAVPTTKDRAGKGNPACAGSRRRSENRMRGGPRTCPGKRCCHGMPYSWRWVPTRSLLLG